MAFLLGLGWAQSAGTYRKEPSLPGMPCRTTSTCGASGRSSQRSREACTRLHTPGKRERVSEVPFDLIIYAARGSRSREQRGTRAKRSSRDAQFRSGAHLDAAAAEPRREPGLDHDPRLGLGESASSGASASLRLLSPLASRLSPRRARCAAARSDALGPPAAPAPAPVGQAPRRGSRRNSVVVRPDQTASSCDRSAKAKGSCEDH